MTHGSLIYIIRARCNYMYLICYLYVHSVPKYQIAIDHRRVAPTSY
jgi:hypothetical protein